MMKTIAVLMLLIGCAAVVGCVSPETTRTRGDGPGADVGNKGPTVKLHEGSDPFWKTPHRIHDQHPLLAPARQAQQLSRP
jgi:hypothetical protein